MVSLLILNGFQFYFAYHATLLEDFIDMYNCLGETQFHIQCIIFSLICTASFLMEPLLESKPIGFNCPRSDFEAVFIKGKQFLYPPLAEKTEDVIGEVPFFFPSKLFSQSFMFIGLYICQQNSLISILFRDCARHSLFGMKELFPLLALEETPSRNIGY